MTDEVAQISVIKQIERKELEMVSSFSKSEQR